MSEAAKRGRPRQFDVDQVLDRSIDVFWQHGFAGTTTRTLEDELEISQSSLYNAFGSKDGLFDQVVERYTQRLDREVLSLLDRPGVGRPELLSFIDAVVAWVDDDRHRGCLVLNLAAEGADRDDRLTAYRIRLRELFEPAVESFTGDPASTGDRVQLLVAAVLGLNISARGGADRDELHRMAEAIRAQIRSW